MEIAEIDVVLARPNEAGALPGPAVTGPVYIGKHRRHARAGTAKARSGDPGSDVALAAQVIVQAKEPAFSGDGTKAVTDGG
jgi:hypothetical protein